MISDPIFEIELRSNWGMFLHSVRQIQQQQLTEQQQPKMAFTIVAACYILALILTAVLIFFAIFHVGTLE